MFTIKFIETFYMDLQQIKYFLAVVDFGTFLAASEQVHVSQPTLSAGIRKLEESLKVTLFHRGSRAASLTPAGELFLSHARQSYNQLMLVKSKLSAEKSKLIIGVLNTIPMVHIAEIIRRYKLANPLVFIEIVTDNSNVLETMLQANQIDLVFSVRNLAGQEFISLFDEHLKLVASTQHPFAKQNKIELHQLSEQPFIERIRCESWDQLHSLFMKNNIKPTNVCRAENDESVLSLVAANLGVSIMPARNTPYAVRFVPIEDLCIKRPVGIYPAETSNTHVQSFVQAAIDYYAHDWHIS